MQEAAEQYIQANAKKGSVAKYAKPRVDDAVISKDKGTGGGAKGPGTGGGAEVQAQVAEPKVQV